MNGQHRAMPEPREGAVPWWRRHIFLQVFIAVQVIFALIGGVAALHVWFAADVLLLAGRMVVMLARRKGE